MLSEGSTGGCNGDLATSRASWLRAAARRPAVAYAVLAVLFMVLLVLSGTSARDAGALTLVIVVSTVGGGVLWLLARRAGTAMVSETLGMGMVLGGLLLLVGHSAFRSTALFPWGGAVLPSILLVSTLVPRVRQFLTTVKISPTSRGEAISLGLGLILGLFLLVPFRLRHPLSFNGRFA